MWGRKSWKSRFWLTFSECLSHTAELDCQGSCCPAMIQKMPALKATIIAVNLEPLCLHSDHTSQKNGFHVPTCSFLTCFQKKAYASDSRARITTGTLATRKSIPYSLAQREEFAKDVEWLSQPYPSQYFTNLV